MGKHGRTPLFADFARRHAGALDLVGSILVRGGGAPLALAANVFIARALGPRAFGLYMTLLSAGLIAGGFSAYGVSPVLTREIAAASPEERPVLIRFGGRWALKLTGSFSLVAMMAVLAWLTLGPGQPSNGWGERLAAAIVIPLCAWATIPTGILVGLSRVAQGQAISTVWKNLLLLIGAALLLTVGSTAPTDFLALQAFSFLLASSIGLIGIRLAVSSPGNACVETDGSPNVRPDVRAWRRSARHFLSISVAWLVLGRIDVVIVNALAGTTQAGYFGAAARLAQIAATAGFVWVAWLQPRLSHIVHATDGTGLRRTLTLGFAGSVGLTAMLVIAAWVAAPEIVALMGTSFNAAIGAFRWLLLGYLFWAASVPFYALLAMANREGGLSMILWLQFAVTISLSVPLVSAYGALGASWSWATGLAFGSSCVIAAGYRQAMGVARNAG